MNTFLLISFFLCAVFLQVSYASAEDDDEEDEAVVKFMNHVLEDNDDDDDEGKPMKPQWGKHGHHRRHHRGHHGRHHGGHRHHHKRPQRRCTIHECEKCFRNKCFRCKDGFFGVLGTLKKFENVPSIIACRARCPEGTKPFKKPSGGSICVKTDCTPNCGMCVKDKCVRCASGIFALPSKTRFGKPINVTCVAHCPNGTRPIKKSWFGPICVKTDCAPNCGTCLGDKCIRCANGSFTLPSKTRNRFGKPTNISCVDECPKGSQPFRFHRVGSNCVKTDCAPNCGMCLGDKCVRCANGSFTLPSKIRNRFGKPINISCVNECPEGTKPIKKPWVGFICVKTDCAPNCGVCVMDKCIRCADGSFALLGKPRYSFGKLIMTCVTKCSAGFTPENTKFGSVCRPKIPKKVPGSWRKLPFAGGLPKRKPNVFG